MKSSNSTRVLGLTQAQIIVLSILIIIACSILAVAAAFIYRNSPVFQVGPAPSSTALSTVPPSAPQKTVAPTPTVPPTLTASAVPASPTPTATQPPTPAAQTGDAAGLLYFTGVNGCEIGWVNALDGSTKPIGSIPLNLCGGWNNLKAWSPDGRQFALVTQTGEPGSPLFSIQILNHDGSPAYQLLSGNGRIGGLFWSPDGQELAYVLYDSETDIYSLRSVQVNGRDHSPSNYLSLTDAPITVFFSGAGDFVSWAPDGKHLAALASEYADIANVDLYLINSQETDFELLLDGGTPLKSLNMLHWSPDGKRILFSDDFFSWKIISIEANSSPEPVINPGLFVAWWPDRSELLFITAPKNGQKQLVAYPDDGSQKQRIVTSENIPEQGPSSQYISYWSPDKSMLAVWDFETQHIDIFDPNTNAFRVLNMETNGIFVWYSPGD